MENPYESPTEAGRARMVPATRDLWASVAGITINGQIALFVIWFFSVSEWHWLGNYMQLAIPVILFVLSPVMVGIALFAGRFSLRACIPYIVSELLLMVVFSSIVVVHVH